MTTLDIQQLTGLTREEARRELAWFYNERATVSVLLSTEDSESPFDYVKLVKGDGVTYFDAFDLDLNLMALIVAAMDEEELGRYETVLHGLYGQMKEMHPFKYLLWLVTLDAQTRFVAVILALKLGRN